MIREIVQHGDVEVKKISTVDNLADPFTKALANKVFDQQSFLEAFGRPTQVNGRPNFVQP